MVLKGPTRNRVLENPQFHIPAPYDTMAKKLSGEYFSPKKTAPTPVEKNWGLNQKLGITLICKCASLTGYEQKCTFPN